VEDSSGRFLANASHASRKDARDAVQAARRAFPGWSTRTPYNRGQVVYRVAEVLEGRRAQLVEDVQRSEGLGRRQADAAVSLSVDRVVWYSGWADKIAQVVGGSNAVAAPYFNFSVPEPTGVVATLAPQGSSLLGLVSVLAPVIVTGNTVVVTGSHRRPLPAVTLAEVLATSDVPAGVVNVLTGPLTDTAPTLASHMDVNAIDLTGVSDDPTFATDLEQRAAENLKRVLRAPEQEPDWRGEPGLRRITSFLETKTVWHPIGV
jgi:acyl-CoA reductase-like NAD-dependent aldehyde dehydrogenase